MNKPKKTEKKSAVKYPNVSVELSGSDGNIFMVIGKVRATMRRAGISNKEIEEFSEGVNSTKSYDEALQFIMSQVEVY